MLQPYGVKIGLKKLARLQIPLALKYLILPVNYWRNLEYRAVYQEGAFQKEDVVLDIGSPKLLALYLSKKVGCKVYATDIESYFMEEYETLRSVEAINPENLILQREDGRNLSFADNMFTKIYSISVLEHVPDYGDSECAAEIGRVLQKGGRCVITVPFSPKSEDVYTSSNFYWAGSSNKRNDGKVFFQRRYSEQDLYERLIGPSGLKLVKKRFYGERILSSSSKEFSEFLPKISGPVQPLLSNLLHTAGTEDWHDLKKPLCALLVLEKE